MHSRVESLPLCKTDIAAESICGMMLVGTDHLVGARVKGFVKYNHIQGRSWKLHILIDTLQTDPVTYELTE